MLSESTEQMLREMGSIPAMLDDMQKTIRNYERILTPVLLAAGGRLECKYDSRAEDPTLQIAAGSGIVELLDEGGYCLADKNDG